MSGHQGQCDLSGDIVAMGQPMGSLFHVASHRISAAGRWRCLWKISSQLAGPTLGMVIVLGVLLACGRRMLRRVVNGGMAAIEFGDRVSIFLHAERLLRRGSIGSLMLHLSVMDWIMLLCVVRVCIM